MRILVLSDIHLGSPCFRRKKELKQVLSKSWDQIIINGDFYELLGFKDKEQIDKENKNILNILQNKNVILINGNHDPHISSLDEYSLLLPNGKKVTLIHGHTFEKTTPSSSFWVKCNIVIYKLFGFEVRRVLRIFKNFDIIEENIVNYYQGKTDYLFYGHTHIPHQNDWVYNSGDWIENCSYIEIIDNQINLIQL